MSAGARRAGAGPLAALLLALVLVGPRAAAAAPGPHGSHPRIWLSSPTLAALKRQVKVKGSWTASAVDLCRHVVRKPGDFTHSGYQGDNWAFAASSCALAWRMTGDPSFAKAGITLWRALLEDVEVMGDKRACVAGRPPQTQNASIWRDTGYAIRFVAPHAALAYDWLYNAPGVDEGLRRQSRDCFASWVGWYTKSGYLNQEPGANYHAGFVIAKTLIAIATAGEDPRGDRAWSEVVNDIFARQIVGRGLAGADPGRDTPPGPLVGGDWPEGWQYGPLSVIEYALAARAVEEQGIKLPQVDRWASEVVLRLLYASTPGGDEIFAGGDTESPTFYLPDNGGGLLAAIAGPASDEAAGWALASSKRFPKLGGSPVFGALGEARSVAPHRYLESPRPLWYLARGTRTVYARSSWDAGAFWTVFTSSRRLVADHQHPDATNFVFTRGHDHLIVDPSPYASRSSLTSNAVTCDSGVVQGDYKPSQTPWSRADLSFVRGTRSGVVAARGDFRQAFILSETPSDIPFAVRDWVFLPEGEIVTIDRVDTGNPARKTYLRFRSPAHLSFDRERRLVTGTTGGSTVAIHGVSLSGGVPVVRSVPAGDCDSGPFGSCKAARLPVDEYAIEIPGPKAVAVHAIDGLAKGERPAEVAPLDGPVIGASVKRAGRMTFVVASARTSPEGAPSMSYEVSGALPARHVVFDAPVNGAGRSAVQATAAKGRCQISIVPAPADAGLLGPPLVFTVAPAAGACAVVEDQDARSATVR